MNRPKWITPDWMKTGDVPADALTDLRANNNQLSVWVVEPTHSNLDVALAAVASNRHDLDKLDYTLVDEAMLPAIPINCVKSEGGTPHLEANASIHRDLTELTVQKVARLAHGMMPLERVRMTEKQVRDLLVTALKSGALDRNRIHSKLLSQLEPQMV